MLPIVELKLNFLFSHATSIARSLGHGAAKDPPGPSYRVRHKWHLP